MTTEEKMLHKQQQIKLRNKASMVINLKTAPMKPLRNKRRNCPVKPTPSHFDRVLPPLSKAPKKSNKRPCFCTEDGPYTAGAKSHISRQVTSNYDQDNIIQRMQDWAGPTGYAMNMPYAQADAFGVQFKVKKVKQ